MDSIQTIVEEEITDCSVEELPKVEEKVQPKQKSLRSQKVGRPTEYRTDPDQLLTAIFEQTVIRRETLDREIRDLQRQHDRDTFQLVQQLHHERLACDWLTYSAETLLDRSLSDGERRATTREILRLEQGGYVEGQGRRLSSVRLTPEGIERVKSHLEKKQAAGK